MEYIKSIIIFNGGAAGDFLKSVCVQQLHQPFVYSLHDSGMVNFKNHYFKNITSQWSKNSCLSQIDYNKVYCVENTHYYCEFYTQLTNNLFYIDYPKKMQSLILKTYIKKRWNNNYYSLWQHHLPSIPEKLQHTVTIDNIEKILNLLWIKNIRTWKNISHLKKIKFEDIISYNALSLVVAELLQQPVPNPAQLKIAHRLWIDKNSNLINFFIDQTKDTVDSITD